MRRGFLIDTNVISETRKAHPNAGVATFFETHPGRTLFISVLTVGELRKGAAIIRKSDQSFADKLSVWIDGIEAMYADRILQIDLQVAEAWADLSSERTRPIIDTLLLATAMTRDLTFVTRNIVDVRGTKATLLNPFL